MGEVRLYDGSNIESLVWPEDEEGQKAKSYLLPLIQEGVQGFISNAETLFFVLALDDLILPITVNTREYHNSYVTSNYYAIFLLQEKLMQNRALVYPFLKPFLRLSGKFLKWLRINKSVMVNNWLVSTSVQPNLSPDQLRKITAFLRGRFSDHMIMFRNVNSLINKDLYRGLGKEKFQLFSSRKVYMYDPQLKELLSSKVHYHHRRDSRLIEKGGYELISEKDLSSEDIPRLLELYEQLYIKKYTPYSPRYTKKFLLNALDKGAWQFIGLRKDGTIDGIVGYFVQKGVMIVPFFGYETSFHHQIGLYRMLTIQIIKKAEHLGVVLNDSSGAETPKKYRGMKPHPEYTAIYVDHLPTVRRFFWRMAGRIYSGLKPK